MIGPDIIYVLIGLATVAIDDDEVDLAVICSEGDSFAEVADVVPDDAPVVEIT